MNDYATMTTEDLLELTVDMPTWNTGPIHAEILRRMRVRDMVVEHLLAQQPAGLRYACWSFGDEQIAYAAPREQSQGVYYELNGEQIL